VDNEKERNMIKKLLKQLRACPEARGWVAEQTPNQAWNNCQRGDWLLWFSSKLGIDKKMIVKAACQCARLTLPYTKDPRVLKCIEVTELWCIGQIDISAVRHAATAADAAATAADAAYAAAAATAADAAAADAAYAAATAAATAATAAAADAAYAAYAADAAYAAATAATAAAYAATAAATAATAAAATAAADAAHFKILQQCADIVRSIIPFELIQEKVNEMGNS
jgi:hypothetical protein